jgi:hypothetical protein
MHTTVWADPEDVRSWAARMPWEFLICRKRRFHHMDDADRAYWDPGQRCYVEILRCSTCHVAYQENLMAATGHYIKRGQTKYDRDSEYLREKGSGRIDKDGQAAINLMVMEHSARKRAPRRLRSVG